MKDAPDDSEKMVVRPTFDVTQGSGNKVEKSANGEFIGIWHGKPVYENGRVKRFQTEDTARAFLARCDAAGKSSINQEPNRLGARSDDGISADR